MLLFVPLISSMIFGQASSSATYDLGDIEADPFYLGGPGQTSSCPGQLTVNIPLGATITGVDVSYDFETMEPYYNNEQRSQLRCVSVGGVAEGTAANNPNWAWGVWAYERTGLTIANDVTAGGDIEFELDAGFDNLAATACGVDYHKVNDGTWTVTVYFLDPNAPVAATNPTPEDGAMDILIDAVQLSWDFGANTEAYDLYLGTDNPPTTMVVENGTSGATGTYDAGTLNGTSNYYWQVVSKNSNRIETPGSVWNFSTECLPATLPVYTDFDSFDAPQWDPNDLIPLCWSKLFQCTEWYALNGVQQTNNAYSAPNCYVMSNEGDGEAWSMLISPQMADDLSTLQLTFMAKSNVADGTLFVGTMSNPTDGETFNEFTAVNATNAGHQEFEVPFGTYTGTDEYIAIRYEASGPWTWDSYYIDNVSIDLAPTCPKSKNLAASNITANSVDLSWLEQGDATQWNIEYDTAGFIPTGTPTITVTENPFTLEGLDDNTAYDFYVQADCGGGDLSAWSVAGNFRTACLSVALPITENFDASLELPPCWNIATTAGTWWEITPNNYNSAPNTFLFYINTVDDNIALVSPQPDVADLSVLQLNFFARDSWQGDKMLIIGTMSDPFDVNSFTDYDTVYTTPEMMEHEIWFNNYSGTDTYLAIRPGNVQSFQYLYIDDITIDYLPSCLAPSDLFVDEVELTSATVHWTENSGATKWTIEAGLPGFTPGTGTYSEQYVWDAGTTPTEYSYNMTGLDSKTYYDVYVQADCGDGDLSDWSKKAQFSTKLPYFLGFPVEENFEDGFDNTGNIPTNMVEWVVGDTLQPVRGNCAYNAYSAENENILLIYGALNLNIFPQVSLSFSHIAKTEGGNDECYVEISTDGGSTFETLPENTYFGVGNYNVPEYGAPEGPCFNEDSYTEWGTGNEIPDNTWWRNETFDLSSYAGNDNVVIRFRLSSNKYSHRSGWFIDNIVLDTYHGTEIGINPESIEVTLEQGTSTTEQITISNLDDFPIAYTATVSNFTDAITTVYSEDFDVELPADWTIEDDGSSPGAVGTWEWIDAAAYGNSLNGTNFMKIQRQYPDTLVMSLISPVIDASGFATTYLAFDQAFQSGQQDYAEVYVWDGSQWVLVYDVTEVTTGAWGNPDYQVINITALANPEFKVKFHYYGRSWSRWSIDNVKVLGSDIPLDWCTINGEVSVSGLIMAGEAEVLDVEIIASDFTPSGSWNVDIAIESNDPVNPVLNIPVTMTLGCDGSPWDFMVTGSVHTISVPVSANPNINGAPLQAGDWVGVFYIDDNGNEMCGGAAVINPFGTAAVFAYGDDMTTPEKDGFAAGERFIWRMFTCNENIQEYSAGASYDTEQSHQGFFAADGVSKLTSLEVMECQYYSIMAGWAGVSTYINPFDADVENLLAPIADELIIMRNLTTVYWPEENINNIGDWDSESGYAIKVNDNVDFEICGADMASAEMEVGSGWSYLPVLSNCEVNLMDLLGENIDNVVIIQDLIGTQVFWPEMEIYTLVNLVPGKSYKIKASSSFDVIFPECNGKPTSISSVQENSMSTIWGNINISPISQIVGFTDAATAEFTKGDAIAAFDENMQLCGYVEFNGSNNMAILLFADDMTTATKDGFNENESVSYLLYRASTGKTFEMEVEYDYTFENTSGNFNASSFAGIKSVNLSTTGIGQLENRNIEMYPNPTTDVITLKIQSAGDANAVIFDTDGRVVIKQSFSQQTQLNVSMLEAGIYYVKVSSEEISEVIKLVINQWF